MVDDVCVGLSQTWHHGFSTVDGWRSSVRLLTGRLIAVEGIDQAGKQTVCEQLVEWLRMRDIPAEPTGFPDYSTPIGREIAAFLRGEREFPPEARQLLYAANRWERASDIRRWLAAGRTVVVDRYVASGIAYGAAQGLDVGWMRGLEARLPAADLTLLLDIPPDVSLARKQTERDAYEARTELLVRARAIYLALAQEPGWRLIDATGDREAVWAEVQGAIEWFEEHQALANVDTPRARYSPNGARFRDPMTGQASSAVQLGQ